MLSKIIGDYLID